MRPTRRDQSGQQDLLRSRLDQIVDLAHPLAKLARASIGRSWNSGSERFTRTARDVRRCRHG
jgi:hypothetical protein